MPVSQLALHMEIDRSVFDWIDSQRGERLRLVRHADAAVKVLLNIHYDTVYPAESKFREVSWADAKTLRGPGVLDAKGGILVMLMAVRALERSNISGRVGYEIVLNPDEEIGSPGSGDLIVEAGKRCDCALLFEPAFSDGWLIDQRKGSGNFVFVVRGRAAHAGREFQLGRSAIVAAAELVVEFCGSLKERGG